MFMNCHRRVFFSLTYGCVLWHVKCTAPASGAVAPTEMKANSFFFLWLVLGLFCCVVFCLFETTEGYSLVAGSTVSHCGDFFCCEAQALGTQAWVVLQCNLSICGSSTYIYTLFSQSTYIYSLFSQYSICGTVTNSHLFFTLFIRMLLLPCLPFPCIAWLTLVCSVTQSCLTLWSHEL